MLQPALAEVSMNRMPNSRALRSPSSWETCLGGGGGEWKGGRVDGWVGWKDGWVGWKDECMDRVDENK